MFEFLKEMQEKKEEQPKKHLNLATNVVFNPNAFREILYNLNKYSDAEIMDMIKNSYRTLFSEKFISENQNNINFIINERFLTLTIRTFNTIQGVDINTIFFCNKLAYDYIHQYTQEEYESMRNILYNLVRVLNHEKVQSLVIIGLPEDISVSLVMARYSASIENNNIFRLNAYIALNDPSIMSVQTIVNIYEKLFDQLGYLFQLIMFTPYTDNQNEETYENIGLAILYMVNNMPSTGIKKVLTSYSDAFDTGMFRQSIKGPDGSIIQGQTYRRYNLEELDYRFARITSMIGLLKEEGIIVP